jgi:biphenyl 2,3-dioxygenase beta subunit
MDVVMETTTVSETRMAAMVRQFEVERFYAEEAALLDAHRYEEWVELFADDATYFVPIRRTRMQRELDQEFTKPGEMAFYNDTKLVLRGRVVKLGTGRSWAEDPPSRTRRLITNVRVTDDDGDELAVESNFLLYRTRLNSQEDSWLGRRADRLRRHDDSFLIAARSVYLEQTVILSRNLSNFF